MTKGLSTFEVPVANDVGLGECKIYGNYELPDQHIIGATRGGVKATIERTIREMGYDGSYGPTKGLRRYDKFVAKVELQSLCLKYQVQNSISDMESDGSWESQDWGQTGGTYTAETTTVLQGDQSAKCTADTINHGIHEVFSASKDLTAFDNGETSDTSDYIGFSIYIASQDITDLNSGNIEIAFHMDAEGTETNLYKYDVAYSALTADKWNTFKVLKSSFTEVGTGDWSAVTGVSFKLDTAPSAEVIFYVDEITMIQATSTLRSSLFPAFRGGMNVTDETTYYKLLPTLEIASADYYENIAIVGQKLDGKAFILILKNCLNDGAISLGINEKDEVVNTTTFAAHFKRAAKTTVPLKIRDYDV